MPLRSSLAARTALSLVIGAAATFALSSSRIAAAVGALTLASVVWDVLAAPRPPRMPPGPRDQITIDLSRRRPP